MSFDSNTTTFLAAAAGAHLALSGWAALYRLKERFDGKRCDIASDDDADLTGCGASIVRARNETLRDMPLFTTMILCSHMRTSRYSATNEPLLNVHALTRIMVVMCVLCDLQTARPSRSLSPSPVICSSPRPCAPSHTWPVTLRPTDGPRSSVTSPSSASTVSPPFGCYATLTTAKQAALGSVGVGEHRSHREMSKAGRNTARTRARSCIN
jgi:hypothetical protein